MEQRVIKFRAWDSKNKFMLDSSYGNWVSFDGVLYEEANMKYNTPHVEIEKRKDLILMQLTGCLDKHNNEIYYSDYMDTEEGLMEVYFIDGKFILMWADTGTYRCDLYPACTQLEVCGNKHTSPELLQK